LPKVVPISGETKPRGGRIPIDVLYPPEPDLPIRPGALRVALRLLQDATDLLSVAVALRWTDLIGSDDKMNRLLPVLEELFCLRFIGEGFAAVINALVQAVRNNSNSVWSGPQLKAISEVLEAVRSEPYLPLEAVLDLTTVLESAGLVPEPREMTYLADCLDAESIR
jgi:hypothetical protein